MRRTDFPLNIFRRSRFKNVFPRTAPSDIGRQLRLLNCYDYPARAYTLIILWRVHLDNAIRLTYAVHGRGHHSSAIFVGVAGALRGARVDGVAGSQTVVRPHVSAPTPPAVRQAEVSETALVAVLGAHVRRVGAGQLHGCHRFPLSRVRLVVIASQEIVSRHRLGTQPGREHGVVRPVRCARQFRAAGTRPVAILIVRLAVHRRTHETAQTLVPAHFIVSSFTTHYFRPANSLH